MRLSSAAVEALMDSPIRREVAKRILNGESAVWILLESGDRGDDDAAANLLRTELKKMEEVLELPILEDYEVGNSTDAQECADLRISFSMIRLSRTDPAEQMLVNMLLHSEWDLRMLSGPIAFPVFGRGRILYALVGDGINENNIREACSFIIGPCSCQVKDLNPGTDLLMSVDWDEMVSVQIVEVTEVPTIAGLSEFVEVTDVTGQDSAVDGTVALEAGETSVEKTYYRGTSGKLKLSILIMMLIGLAGVAIATYILKSKGR